MELKQFQRKVIQDIRDYLYEYKTTENASQAYENLWLSKGVNVGFGGIQRYVDELYGKPQVCIKVPTGGGKTFIASSAIKTIFDFFPANKRVVLWLVPTEPILTQTLKNLKNPSHPYRQKLNSDFSSRVEVFSKEEALRGQNFNISSVDEQLNIFVMSFDSFRTSIKEGRKVYQENSSLVEFTKNYELEKPLVKGADTTSLIQIFNHLNPVIIVDESHNATSTLSLNMLNDLNPCFVLDLTATPRENSNIISIVDAMQLKKEQMVKLPVIVYNRPSQNQVIVDAIDLRNKLENFARYNEKETEIYIRPIVLFQAQPKTDEDNTTFEVLKEKLIKVGIPKEEIAIKTANINELKNVDLTSRQCKIKYIVTVNALKEGWDCPFAYILASVANKTSSVDVEQIVGRILRQPYTKNYENNALNMSYVLTSSRDFNSTLTKVLDGLNSAGFSDRDYRSFDLSESEKELQDVIEKATEEPIDGRPAEDLFEFSVEEVKEQLEQKKEETEEKVDSLDIMMQQAEKMHDSYKENAEKTDFGGLFGAESQVLNIKEVNYMYEDIINDIKLPQFYINVAPNIFNENKALVSKKNLLENFTLRDKRIPTNLATVTEEAVKIDIEENRMKGSKVKTWQMSGRELSEFKSYLESIPNEKLANSLVDMIYHQMKSVNSISSSDLKDYLTRIIRSLNQDELISVRDNLFSVTYKIDQTIEELKNNYAYEIFKIEIEKGNIKLDYQYEIPNAIAPNKSGATIAKTFYNEEADDLNNYEKDMIRYIAGLSNVRCWHRIMDRKSNEFYINGFINHYPDFWIVTEKGNFILMEVKGEHMTGEDTKRKAELGKIWQNEASSKFRYYMVYKDKEADFEGAYKFTDFVDILKSL